MARHDSKTYNEAKGVHREGCERLIESLVYNLHTPKQNIDFILQIRDGINNNDTRIEETEKCIQDNPILKEKWERLKQNIKDGVYDNLTPQEEVTGFRYHEREALIDYLNSYKNKFLKDVDPNILPTGITAEGLAEYHNNLIREHLPEGQTMRGKTAKLTGSREHQSKVICTIITLPQGYKGNTDEFFYQALQSHIKILNIREEDILYAVIHYDETTPHLHIMALPVVREENSLLISVQKLYKNGYTSSKEFFDNYHPKLIEEMKARGIEQADLLLNGATEDKAFIPSQMTYEQRKQSLELANQNNTLKEQNEALQSQIEELQEQVNESNDKLIHIQSSLEDIRRNVIKTVKETISNFFTNIVENIKTAIRTLDWNIIKSIKSQIETSIPTQQIEQTTQNVIPDIISSEELEKKRKQRLGYIEKSFIRFGATIENEDIWFSEPMKEHLLKRYDEIYNSGTTKGSEIVQLLYTETLEQFDRGSEGEELDYERMR